MDTDANKYIQAVLDMYLSLPLTPNRYSSLDRAFAHDLYQQKTPLPIVETALLLASVRRLYRNPTYPPLPPIRSLRYFLPVIEEVFDSSISPSYLQYLRQKIIRYRPPTSGSSNTPL